MEGSTERLYLTDTYLFETTSTILSISPSETDPALFDIVLDRTIFHPQGGGQPSDVGTLLHGPSNALFHVTAASSPSPSTVLHTGRFSTASHFSPGDTITASIDRAARITAARTHSAGHLIDSAMQGLVSRNATGFGGVGPARKGYHFATGAYVEFEGNVDAGEREEAGRALESAVMDMVRGGGAGGGGGGAGGAAGGGGGGGGGEDD
mmetsp:Transcript_13774/g.36717  ORF Transcript_13774/g.36717 Transcript_13774/m.36717 type:complete len:208 (+) Transcript_13774:493-1116(+)